MSVSIKVNIGRCTGCRVCQLWCSYSRNKVFSLEDAFIQVHNPYGLQVKITFKEECNNCGQCAFHCLYNALIITEELE
ncbi:MAG: hypothetical protein ACTSR8_03240 [Promethearchaeota archaeon]